VDVVSADAALSGYKLVLAPNLNVISSKLATRLLEYAEQGGHLVLGPRSGMKDEYNALNVERQPGPLVKPLGGRVEQYYALSGEVPVGGELGAGTANVWAEQLSTREKDAYVLLRYGKSNGWLDGQPAMITRKVGKGSISYLGALLDANLMRSAIAWMTGTAQVQPEFGSLPPDVEVCRRVGLDYSVFILINHGTGEHGTGEHGTGEATIHLPGAMEDVLHEGRPVSELVLEAQGVAILEKHAK
jgi:beta-galactosidase